MKAAPNDDDSLDATLDRYVRKISPPPSDQVESSVDAVWERLSPEAEYVTLPAREVERPRSYLAVGAAVAVATVAIGLYAIQHFRQQRAALATPLVVENQTPSVNPAPAPVVVESKKPEVAPEFPKSKPVPRLAFEVAAIHPIPFPVGSGGWTVNEGLYGADPTFVRDIIGFAYNVRTVEVRGGPRWLDQDPYSFDGWAGSRAVETNQIRRMLQTLLAERFKLAIHRETEEAMAYKLVVAKSGPKLQEAQTGQPASINWSGLGHVTVTENSDMSGLISILSTALGGPVRDETGLKGSYSFNLEFSDPRKPRTVQADAVPDLFTAVEQQLGLRIEGTKGRVEVVVIDKIEKPSEN